jgi:hypothetical protein
MEANKFKNIDLTSITLLALKDESIKNVEVENISYIESLYKTFLYLHKLYPNQKFVPSIELDTFWHNHILYSKKYFEDCTNLFGKYLHHNPNFDENQNTLNQVFNKTKRYLKRHFKDINPNVNYKENLYMAVCSSCSDG